MVIILRIESTDFRESNGIPKYIVGHTTHIAKVSLAFMKAEIKGLGVYRKMNED